MLENNFKVLDRCVCCSSSGLVSILDLGNQPPANEYLEHGSNQHNSFPLKLMSCQNCSHAQLSVAVSPELLFRFYSYVSGTTKTLNEYFVNFVNRSSLFEFANRKIIEIASNDGSLLKIFRDNGWKVIGVDPAINLLEKSQNNGIITIPEFFTLELSEMLAKDFDLIVAMNVFAHTASPKEMLLAMKACLSQNGLIAIQTSQADMFFDGQFDTIYHEHISFFNVKSMKTIVESCGLFLVGVEIEPIHGNSYVWWISNTGRRKTLGGIDERMALENDSGLYSGELYGQFFYRAESVSRKVLEIVTRLKHEGYTIVAYGAAAKGNTFMAYAGITPDIIIDDNPLKIGRVSPIGSLQVFPSEFLRSLDAKAFFLIPAWNFKDEITEKIKTLRKDRKGDLTLTYFPDISLVELK